MKAFAALDTPRPEEGGLALRRSVRFRILVGQTERLQTAFDNLTSLSANASLLTGLLTLRLGFGQFAANRSATGKLPTT